MAPLPPLTRQHSSTPRLLRTTGLALLLGMLLALYPLRAALAAEVAQHYRCDGDPLVAIAHNGAVDAADIPNSSAGTLPGAFVVLKWRGLSLQLPRTNNAGSPSYTDGRWWWLADDADHPVFAQRRAAAQNYSCQPDRAS